MDNLTIEKLIRGALTARNNAYAPYSNYKVGACVLTSSDKYFSGINALDLAVCKIEKSLAEAVAPETDLENRKSSGKLQTVLSLFPLYCLISECVHLLKIFWNHLQLLKNILLPFLMVFLLLALLNANNHKYH